MTDGFDEKSERAGAKATPQHEVDAQALREKTARLRELRLAHQPANKTATGAAGKRTRGQEEARQGFAVVGVAERPGKRRSTQLRI